MKSKLVLVAAVVAGLLAALLVNAWLKGKASEVEKLKEHLRGKAKKTNVVAAAKPLPKGTVITMDVIGNKNVWEEGLRGHAVRSEDYRKILGRKLEQSLESGATVFWSDLEGGKTGYQGLSRDIGLGMRGVSIAVSGANAVSGMVRPGDTVDVLGSFMFDSEGAPAESELVTLTVLQNVTVLATGQETAKTIDDSRNQHSSYSTVTLEVTPREAEVLVFAQQMKGRLSLTLRNPSDVRFESELPKVDFKLIESELRKLNEYRQSTIRGGSGSRRP